MSQQDKQVANKKGKKFTEKNQAGGDGQGSGGTVPHYAIEMVRIGALEATVLRIEARHNVTPPPAGIEEKKRTKPRPPALLEDPKDGADKLLWPLSLSLSLEKNLIRSSTKIKPGPIISNSSNAIYNHKNFNT
uniref:Uncharacterized protein n=1 Tax=Romanomermis culicivorax TaxID=13658 RepID=A0A915J011_ROMCU